MSPQLEIGAEYKLTHPDGWWLYPDDNTSIEFLFGEGAIFTLVDLVANKATIRNNGRDFTLGSYHVREAMKKVQPISAARLEKTARALLYLRKRSEAL